MNLKIPALILAITVSPASAGVIHKWVDENGVTHYSDEAPANRETLSTQIDLPEPAATDRKSGDDYYSIANQWARMHQESLEREKLRVQTEQAKTANQPAVTNIYVEDNEKDGYALVYRKPYYKKRRHKKKQHENYNPGYTRRFYQAKYPPGLHPGRNASQGALGQTY